MKPIASALTLALFLTGCAASGPDSNDATLELIQGRPDVEFAAGKRSSGWLAMHSERKPVVHGQVGDVDVQILLDSGAGITVVDETLLASGRLELQGTQKLVGVDGNATTVRIVAGLDVQLGDLALTEVPAIAMDLGAARRDEQAPPIVILGIQVFHELVIDIDYPRGRVALHDPEGATRPTGRSVPLRLLDDRCVALPVQLPDTTAHEFLLDTGSDSGVILLEAKARPMGLLEGTDQDRALLGGVGGQVEIRRIALEQVSLAGQAFESVPCDLLPATDSGWAAAGVAGLVGGDLLRRARWVIDAGAGEATLVGD